MDNQKQGNNVKPQAMEGEGNHTADRRYREGVQETVRSGKTEELGKKAARALDGAEGDDLREAEAAAKRGEKR